MSLLLPMIALLLLATLMLGLAGIAIDHRDGLPYARTVIAVLLVGGILCAVALAQTARVASSLQHAPRCAATAPVLP